jgi:hypothetical protein
VWILSGEIRETVFIERKEARNGGAYRYFKNLSNSF